MMSGMPQGDASVQSAAEAVLRAEVSTLLNVDLVARRLSLPDGNQVAVDAVADQPQILCEIFARVGTLKGGQIKKVAEDLLKLITIQRLLPEWREARIVLVFASEDAASSVRGWLLGAIRAWGAELLVVPVEAGLREQLLAAQREQWMGYADTVSTAEGDATQISARRWAEHYSYDDDSGLTFYDADSTSMAPPSPPTTSDESPQG